MTDGANLRAPNVRPRVSDWNCALARDLAGRDITESRRRNVRNPCGYGVLGRSRAGRRADRVSARNTLVSRECVRKYLLRLAMAREESNRRYADFQESCTTHGDLLNPAKSHLNAPRIYRDLTPSDPVTRELTRELTPAIT